MAKTTTHDIHPPSLPPSRLPSCLPSRLPLFLFLSLFFLFLKSFKIILFPHCFRNYIQDGLRALTEDFDQIKLRKKFFQYRIEGNNFNYLCLLTQVYQTLWKFEVYSVKNHVCCLAFHWPHPHYPPLKIVQESLHKVTVKEEWTSCFTDNVSITFWTIFVVWTWLKFKCYCLQSMF